LNPINELILGTKRIEEGDLSYKVPMFSVIEFRFLSESFNKMVQKLKHNVDLLVKEKNNLLKTKNLLEVKSKELQSSLVKMQNIREELIKEESYAIIGRLVSTVAHELNNSLAGIDNIAYYLINMNDLRDEKSQKMIRLMLDSVRRISVVVSNLIIFSKRCGKKIYRTDTYVDEIVNQSIESVKLPKNIKIHKEMEHFKAFIDPVKMIQIMRTFILNSIDAISNDYGNIEISIKRIADMVEIKIKDNGCGISKENTKYMFEPFFTTKLKGVGLDLCIAKDIIAAHKGTITINSLENIGTNISVVFPISNIK
jgi:signal transduction histidine kinase